MEHLTIANKFRDRARNGCIYTLSAARVAVEGFGAVVRPLDHGFDGRENYARWVLTFPDGEHVLAVAGDGDGRHGWPEGGLADYLGGLELPREED